MQRSEEVWGSTASKFNPDRHLSLPSNVKAESHLPFPTPYGGLLTFLAGPRNCVGWRFAVTIMKIVLSILIREFEFDLWHEDMVIVEQVG